MTKLRLPLILVALLLLAAGLGGLSWFGSSDGPRLAFIDQAFAMGGNPPPEAYAGPDLTTSVGATVILDGTGTTDPKERSLQNFTWSVISVPAGSLASLDDTTLVKPSFLADQPGDYVFQLIVNQGNRSSDPDQVTISTVNSAPVADPGQHRRVAVSDTITLDATGSTDRDGDPLTYSWSIATAPAGSVSTLSSATALRPTFFIDQGGDYVFELTVNDGTTNSVASSVELTTNGNLHPVSDAGLSRAAAPGDSFTFQPGMVGDADGDDTALDWALISRPAGSAASLTNPNSVRPGLTIDVAGTYIVQLVADDGPLDGVDTLAIDTVNNPPKADAGPAQAAGVGAVITLDAAASSDAEGDTVTYRWDLVSQPAASTATLDDPAALRPSFTIDVAGVYVAQLIVADVLEESQPATITVDGANSAPRADAGPDQAISTGATVQLDAVASSDPDGDPLTYEWTILERPSGPAPSLSDPTVQNPTFTATKAGDYLISLRVSDGDFESGPDTVLVSTDNIAPVANAGGDQSVMGPGVVQLDGAGSSDANSDPLTYSWALIHVPAGSTATLSDPAIVNPTITIDVVGDYVAQLVVTDGTQASTPDTIVFTLSNNPPVADAGPDQNIFAGQIALLDGSGSSDADDDPLTYVWTLTVKPAGSTAILSNPTTASPSFTADLDGIYVAELIVNDGEIDSDPDTVTITAAPNDPPIANAGPDQNVTLLSLVQLNGNGSNDPNFQPITFAWSILSTPLGSTAVLSDPAAAMPTFTADLVGTYDIQLIVNDGLLNSTPDTVTITADAVNGLPVLAAIGNQSVDLGTTLNLQLSATDPDLDLITFLAVPLPLPAGAILDGMTGAFTFQPDASQVGTIDLTFMASDGIASDSEAITITVNSAQPGGITAISGRLLDANDAVGGATTPVVGAVIGFKGVGTTATSDANGNFTLSSIPSGSQILEIDSTNAGLAPDGSRYGSFTEEFVLIADVTNVVDRPFYLPRIDASSAATVVAGSQTVVANPTLGVSMTIAADTAMNADGTAFAGVIYISQVPTEFAPVELPEDLEPNVLLSIQSTAIDVNGNIVPVTFTQPVPISFPNNDNLVVGSQVDIYSLDAATGSFKIVGLGQVDITGTLVETMSGGITTTTWHLPSPPGFPPGGGFSPGGPGSPGNCRPQSGSTAASCTGNLEITHALPVYRSLNQDRGLSFIYNSTAADPQPIVLAKPTIPVLSAVPASVSTRLFVGGVQVSEELYTSTSVGVNRPGGLLESVDETLLLAPQFDAKDMVSGNYTVQLAVTNNHSSGTRATARVLNEILVNNEIDSPFGAGWTMNGLQRLHLQGKSPVLTDGSGAILRFENNFFGEGSFSSGASFGSFPSTNGHAVGDIDGDGDLDIAVPDGVTGTVSVLLNDGSGAYPTQRTFGTGGTGDAIAVAIGDFNSDGLGDIAVAHQSPDAPVSVHMGLGAGFFAPMQLLATNILQTTTIGVGDFDSDGNDDIVIAGIPSQNLSGRINRFFGNGNGGFTFSFTNNALGTLIPVSLHVEDIRGDGGDDIVITNAQNSGFDSVTVFTNDSARGILHENILADPIRAAVTRWQIEAADLNGDGIKDIVVANEDTTVDVLIGNNLASQFANGVPVQIGFEPRSIDLGDFNGDGDTDLVAISEGNIPALGAPGYGIMLGDGAGGFLPGTFFPAASANALVVADVDGDSLGDLVLSSNPMTVHYATPPIATVFATPAPDFSTLERHADSTFTRTMKNGTRIEFDAAGFQTAVIDRNNNSAGFFYDAQGRLETITDAASLSTTLAYGADGKLDTVTDPAGRITTFMHDAEGDLTRIIDADLSERDFTYDVRHRVSTQTNERDFTTTYEYGHHGRFVQSNLPDGSTRKLVPSQTIAVIDTSLNAGTNGTAASPASFYEPTDMKSVFTDGRGNDRITELDDFGRATSITDQLTRVTLIERDAMGQATRGIAPNGRIIEFVVDELGNVQSTTEAVGDVLERGTSFTYEPVFNLIKTSTDADGKTTVFDYDPNGNLTKLTDALLGEMTFTYEPNGLLKTITDWNNNPTTFAYDTNWNLDKATDARGDIVDLTVDTAGNVIAVTEAFGTPEARTSNMVFDAINRLQSITDAATETTTFDYDAMGNLIESMLPTGEITFITYDPLDRVASVDDPTTGITTRLYDLNGNLNEVTNARGATTSYVYDAANQLTKVTDALLNTQDFLYDLNGNVTNVTDERGFETTFDYDLLDRRSGRTNPLTDLETFEYDSRDNLTKFTTAKGDLITSFFDELNRLKTVTTPDNLITFGYDAGGNMLTATDDDSDLTLTYDVLNRAETVSTGVGGIQPVVTLTNTFNSLGERSGLADSLGGAWTYGYDPLSRLAALTTPANDNIGITYDPTGRMNTITRPSGINTAALYDVAGRLSSLVDGTGAIDLQAFGYTGYDLVGNITEITEGPSKVRNFNYDLLNRVTAGGLDGLAENYGYDELGNRTASHISISHLVNDTNQLLSDDKFTYTYDLNGNLETKTDVVTLQTTTYHWNTQDQLTSIDLPGGGTATYAYDALGRRIEKNVNGSVTAYVYDGEDIALEFDGSGVLLARYSHGQNTDQPLTMERNGQTYYYHTDHLGSIRLVTDSTGAVLNRYDYDAYGNFEVRSEGVTSPYTFTGREFDAESGLFYYRARYYDANAGRFISEDPIGFGAGDANQYRYVFNNPVNSVDPTGLCRQTRGFIPGATCKEKNIAENSFGIGIGTGGSRGRVINAVIAGGRGAHDAWNRGCRNPAGLLTAFLIGPDNGETDPNGLFGQAIALLNATVARQQEALRKGREAAAEQQNGGSGAGGSGGGGGGSGGSGGSGGGGGGGAGGSIPPVIGPGRSTGIISPGFPSNTHESGKVFFGSSASNPFQLSATLPSLAGSSKISQQTIVIQRRSTKRSSPR